MKVCAKHQSSCQRLLRWNLQGYRGQRLIRGWEKTAAEPPPAPVKKPSHPWRHPLQHLRWYQLLRRMPSLRPRKCPSAVPPLLSPFLPQLQPPPGYSCHLGVHLDSLSVRQRVMKFWNRKWGAAAPNLRRTFCPCFTKCCPTKKRTKNVWRRWRQRKKCFSK